MCIEGSDRGGTPPFLLLSHDTHRENGDHDDNDRHEHHTTNSY